MTSNLSFLAGVLAFIAMIGAAGAEPATGKERPHRQHHARFVKAFVPLPPAPAVEVQRWSDGVADVQGWCFIPDPEFRGLGVWRYCGVY